MHLAVASKNLQLVKELIAAGVNVSATNAQKETPLHYAYAFRQLAIVRELEKAGADKNAQDARGVKCEDVEWEVDK
jgi:ankyrin repeat protein